VKWIIGYRKMGVRFLLIRWEENRGEALELKTIGIGGIPAAKWKADFDLSSHQTDSNNKGQEGPGPFGSSPPQMNPCSLQNEAHAA